MLYCGGSVGAAAKCGEGAAEPARSSPHAERFAIAAGSPHLQRTARRPAFYKPAIPGRACGSGPWERISWLWSRFSIF